MIGECIVERKNYLSDAEKGIADSTRDNRNRFAEFLKIDELRPVNTWFQKPLKKLVTHKEKVPQHNPDKPENLGGNQGPYDYTKYAQCDYMVTRGKFSHTIKDCEVRIGNEKNSNHYPIYTEIRTSMKLAETEKKT